jgi:hypothetical protein
VAARSKIGRGKDSATPLKNDSASLPRRRLAQTWGESVDDASLFDENCRSGKSPRVRDEKHVANPGLQKTKNAERRKKQGAATKQMLRRPGLLRIDDG